MYHYLFTNDLRVTVLDESLKKAGHCFVTNTVPPSSVDKSANNNMMTLGFYFTLNADSNCAKIAASGNARAVVLNFIKKFQFPNMRTSSAYTDSKNDGIKLAPMRVIVKLLYTMNLLHSSAVAYLTKEEIKYFIFYNDEVAKKKNADIGKLINDILEHRRTGNYPTYISTDENDHEWKHEDRQIREMLKVLQWSGCITERDSKYIIDNDGLSNQEKADVFDIITCDSFWEGTTIESYREYMDMPYEEDDAQSLHKELTPEWFEEKAKDFPDYDSKAEELRKSFLEKYAVEKLEPLSGKELLTTIFLNDENKENLCYELEFNADMRQYFGSIKSGTAYKYGLHYSKKNNTWATGSHMNPNFIDEEAAIELGTKIRDDIVAGAKILEDTAELNSVQDYLELYKKLSVATDGYINKIWVAKYYQMLRPELFPPIYSSNAQETVCKAIKETPNDNILCRMAQIRFYANECHISNILFSRVFWTYATNIIDNDEIGENDMSDEAKQVCTFDSEKCVEYVNLIVYGTPGCGKSYYVKNDLLKDYKQENIIRTTFYQDYTNTDFVGQILPTVSGNDVTYEFNPGPFTLALERAISNPQEPVALVIEELNRGNAPSIFGDIFQLLDRENGKSEYQITNVNVQKYLSDKIEDSLFEYIMIPSNLSIVATMNTSDQNVFTLDTAFKRRWDYKKLKNKFNEDHPYKDYYVPGMPDTTWETFVNSVNDFIVSASSDLQSEDKQLGVFFVAENLLLEDSTDDSDEKAEKFAYKVLEYLWDDVAKFDRDAWFNEKIKSLDELVEEFVESGKEVFKDGIFKQQNS